MLCQCCIPWWPDEACWCCRREGWGCTSDRGCTPGPRHLLSPHRAGSESTQGCKRSIISIIIGKNPSFTKHYDQKNSKQKYIIIMEMHHKKGGYLMHTFNYPHFFHYSHFKTHSFLIFQHFCNFFKRQKNRNEKKSQSHFLISLI